MDYGEALHQRLRTIMDELNHSAPTPPARGSSSSHRSNVSRDLSHSARLDRIRRTLRARTSETLEARRRRSLGLGVDDNPNNTNYNIPQDEGLPTGKRRKLDQNQAQTEMVQLDLELAYCDGGKYKETNTRPESVLYQDDTVYCTRGSNCNMIFKHADEKCFTLEKIVIQGPAVGYTSPVQEGIIFVTMDKNDLVSGLKYPFRFEHSGSDNEEDDEEDDDDDGLDESDDDIEPNELELPRLATFMRSNSPPSFFESVTSSNVTVQQQQQQASGLDSKPIEPSARFKIRPDAFGKQMKATLTFEPALSGRYILARFASPRKNDNIDIQFIGAWGYVGRRFFPAITPR